MATFKSFNNLVLKTHMIDTQGDLQPGGSRRILTTSKPGAVGKQLLQRLTRFFADQDRTTAGEEVCPYGEWVGHIFCSSVENIWN